MGYVRLQTVELALDYHALLRTIAGAVFYDHMDIDPGGFPVRARDMKLPCRLGIMLVEIGAFHALLYYECR
jgi:hypothetical protein